MSSGPVRRSAGVQSKSWCRSGAEPAACSVQRRGGGAARTSCDIIDVA